MSKLYIGKEFPIYQASMKRKKDIVFINFKLINKYAAEMRFIISYENPHKKFDPKSWENRTGYSELLNPLETKDLEMRIYWPKKNMGNIKVRFFISTNDGVFEFYKTINMDI